MSLKRKSLSTEEDHTTIVERYDGPAGLLKKRTTTSFDELSRPWEDRRFFETSLGIINPDSVTTTWCNARGQVVQVQDPNGNLNTRTYDTAARLTSAADAIGNQKTYTLDANGNALSMSSVDWNQVTLAFETYVRNAVYDQLNRMTQLLSARRERSLDT